MEEKREKKTYWRERKYFFKTGIEITRINRQERVVASSYMNGTGPASYDIGWLPFPALRVVMAKKRTTGLITKSRQKVFG